ncbi:septum formation protein [Rhizodiscina lignyota]|uniref:Septum formation protein n=1 Tax=Rhizodiscina lignyota TaxID=1504668 RepID=A0A9P4IF39_9PEZI|nr:septum formation protein [Rhizodiscina lignyota]
MADSKDANGITPTDPPPSYDSAAQPSPVVAGAPAPSSRPPGPRAPLPLELPVLTALRGRKVILASASPRRKQLLAQIGLTNITISPSTFAEDLSKSLSPLEYVLQTATKKAMTVYQRECDNDPALIIAADTIVIGPNGTILEKPRNEKEHIGMLRALRDAVEHKVCTGVACIAPLESALDPGYALETHVEETSVRFDSSVTDDLILAYVRTREGADKAGGYGIQGMGSLLVEGIAGDYNNVVGLPLRATLQMIEKVLNPEVEDEDDEEG